MQCQHSTHVDQQDAVSGHFETMKFQRYSTTKGNSLTVVNGEREVNRLSITGLHPKNPQKLIGLS